MGGSRREPKRCRWVGTEPLMQRYHDEEWGVPVHDDRVLFEFLLLEGAQAGLSWSTILRKRENYRKAFVGFEHEKIARFTPARIERLLQDAGLVRNRLKMQAAVLNAKLFKDVAKEHGSFSAYAWSFVGGKPLQVKRGAADGSIVTTPESDAFSADLKRRGFKFVGSTIMYAFMQAVGMVNDHDPGCARRAACRNMAR